LLWLTLLALGVLAVLTLALRPRGLTQSRLGRSFRLGRLSARMSASWLGARVRRLFAGKERRVRLDAAARAQNAQLVAKTMGEMKGALMKLGQMMSFVSEDVPPEMRAALQSLQTSAPPMDFALLRDQTEEQLGRPLERAFARFDEAALASASIGQVHGATLPDGREVVVKIQYPGVADAIRADLANAGLLYRFVGTMYPSLEPGPVVDELRERITEELDYAREAENQRAFHARYLRHPTIKVPGVIDSHSAARVLTTERVSGRRFAEILAADQATRDHYGEIMYRFVFGSVLRDGCFNGDPHPGNYLFGDGVIYFLDYGCVKYFPAEMLKNWKALARASLDGDSAEFRRKLVSLSFIKEDSPPTGELMHDYFRYFYAPFVEDRQFQFTRDYTSTSFRHMFAPTGKFVGLSKHLNMPRDFVFVNRIQWGVWSILADLRATGNFHRIHREYLYGDPPSTPMGEAERASQAPAPAA
jgi:predicted unusual protein kinase regulating ubiquinone biosynthesis (AarF/ABC1/UbiB family)